jgi:choline dehydrogenase-like flavoprotein
MLPKRIRICVWDQKEPVVINNTYFRGATMGENSTEGVVDKNNKIFRYKNLYIIDSSMISANLGVNLSLSITAIAERAMDQILLKTLRFLMKITVINQR